MEQIAPDTSGEAKEESLMRPAPNTIEPDTNEQVMTYKETAHFLGISERTLERYVCEARIPYVQLPRRGSWAGVRFLRSQLLSWLAERTVKASRRRADDNGRQVAAR